MAEEVLSITGAVACSDHELLLALIMFVELVEPGMIDDEVVCLDHKLFMLAVKFV